MTGDKQRQILEGVWAVIAHDGIAVVSMRSVAAAAGVSVGRVQHHFGTKTELVRASVTAMLDAAAQANPDALAATSHPDTLRSLLVHPITPAGQSRAGMSVFYAYVAASVTDPWIGEQLAHAKRQQVQQVARCLTDQLPHIASPHDMAARLVALADGCTQAIYLGHSTPGAAIDTVNQALVELREPPGT